MFRPHQLADELEKLLHEKEVTGRAAWTRLFDETVAGDARDRSRGEELTVSAALNKLSDRDRARARGRRPRHRRRVRRTIRLFALITNTLAKDKEIVDTLAALSARRRATATAPTWSRTRWSMRW